MIRKSQLFLALAGLIGMNAAMAACNTTAWGDGGVAETVGTPVPGNPISGDADGVVHRYSGGCGLRAATAGNYVLDGTPGAEGTYIARFYVLTGVTGGTGTVFRAIADQAGTPDNVIDVVFTGSTFDFRDRANVSHGTLAASPDKWYAVELKWTRASTNLDVKVQGAGSATGLVGNFTGYSVETPASHGIDTVQLGYIAGTATASARGGFQVDAFESRRSTDIGRLCRGDSNNSGNVSPADRSAITAELNLAAPILAPGQPDCNEDGQLSPADRSCVTGLLGQLKNACDGSW